MKKSTLFLALCLAGLSAAAQAGIYPMEGGDLRRENRNLSPTSIANPLIQSWRTSPCGSYGLPMGGPVILADRVVQAYQKGVACRDRNTGAILWNWPTGDQLELYNTPTYDPDRNLLYVGTIQGDTLALDPSTGNVSWIYGHDPSLDTLPDWYYWQYSSPMLAENHLFVGTGGVGFRCIDASTRSTVWDFNFSTYFGTDHKVGVCTPAYDAAKVYFSTTDGDLFCLNSGDGSVVWHVQTPGYRQNGLLLTDDCVYNTDFGGGVQCRRKTDGSLVWEETLTGMTSGNLAVCGDLLIVPGDWWRLWALDRHTGHTIWCTLLTGNFARSSPFVVCGKVYISACHGDFCGLDGQSGKVEWTFHNAAYHSFVDWAEDLGQMYVCDSAGRMYCFTARSPINPTDCVCNLQAKWTPEPTAAWTPTPTPTPVPTQDWTGFCPGTLDDWSSPDKVQVFFDASSASPPNDGSGNTWISAGYQEPAPWRAASAVTQIPGEWTAPCEVKGSNAAWVAAFPNGLPPTLADAFFRSTFDLPSDASVTATSLVLSGDNIVEAYLNGTFLGRFENTVGDVSWLYASCVTVTADPFLCKAGRNVLAFRLINQADYHGLSFEWSAAYSEACTMTFTPTPTATFTNTQTPTPTESGSATSDATSTPTATDTATSTPTGTLSAASSPTETGSATATPSDTGSPTPASTETPTSTPTLTETWTATPTSTSTDSDTTTSTPTETLSAASSPTETGSATATSSDTGSPTPASTETPTYTPTLTETWTATPTSTSTDSDTITSTSTPTSTHTSSFTSTPTSTETWTPTSTATATPTSTSTPKSSFTSTPTSTETWTPTSTATATPISTSTASNTPTSTSTPTSSFTPTPTPTETWTATATTTETSTSTSTASNTPTSTSTLTSTPTSSFTPTPTPTETWSSSATTTASPTSTITTSFTPTPTATTGSGCHHGLYPNPCQDHVRFQCGNGKDCSVQCRVFSLAGRLLHQENRQVSGIDNGISWNLRDDGNRLLSNGLYYVEMKVKDSTGEKRYIEKLFILR